MQCLVGYSVVLFNYSDTPLHWAAHGGHQEVVRLLLDRAAHVDEKNNNGYSNYSHLNVLMNLCDASLYLLYLVDVIYY